MASGDNAHQRYRNCQCERVVQTEGRKLESYAENGQDVDTLKTVQAGGTPESSTNKRQDSDTQCQHNADNTTEPCINTNPMIMGKKNNENSFLSELTINGN